MWRGNEPLGECMSQDLPVPLKMIVAVQGSPWFTIKTEGTNRQFGLYPGTYTCVGLWVRRCVGSPQPMPDGVAPATWEQADLDQ